MSSRDNIEKFIRDVVDNSPVDTLVTKAHADEFVGYFMERLDQAQLNITGYTISQNGAWLTGDTLAPAVEVLQQQVVMLKDRLEEQLEEQGREHIGGCVEVLITAEVMTWPLETEENTP